MLGFSSKRSHARKPRSARCGTIAKDLTTILERAIDSFQTVRSSLPQPKLLPWCNSAHAPDWLCKEIQNPEKFHTCELSSINAFWIMLSSRSTTVVDRRLSAACESVDSGFLYGGVWMRILWRRGIFILRADTNVYGYAKLAGGRRRFKVSCKDGIGVWYELMRDLYISVSLLQSWKWSVASLR